MLIDVRTLLHARSRRSTDILEPEFAAGRGIADALGYRDRYELTAAVVAAEATPLAFDVLSRNGQVTLTRKPDLTDPTDPTLTPRPVHRRERVTAAPAGPRAAGAVA